VQARIAAIDVGSNSMRVAVIDTDGRAALEVVQEARAVPRLIRDVRASGRLSPESIRRILDVLEEFVAIARSARATDVLAVATSAVRDATNADELVAAVRADLGLELRVVTGEEEGRLAFLGALHSLPVTDGVLVDIGGGSAEVVRFRHRAPEHLVSLQLGAVRLTDEFLHEDPPSAAELKALRKHVDGELQRGGLGRLPRGARVVGTGGTVRNLAKMARARYGYPLPHLHGYALTRERLHEMTADLTTRARAERVTVAGLNEDRADTIVAGAIVIEAMLEAARADEVVVSGQGLREGVAVAHLGGELVTVPELQAEAVRTGLARFAPGAGEAAARRRRIATELVEAFALPEDIGRMTPVAAALLDLGTGIDYYNRHRHTESILLARGLDGFSHREQALIGALVRQSNTERYDALAYAPLIGEADVAALGQAATLLQLADQLEQRLPAALFRLDVAVDLGAGTAAIAGDVPRGWDPGALRRRFGRAFGLNLAISGASEA
jgi:exopolyphosphatase/guanosine-5'-triphosphate,3'-diphosphate pyrophosphatase